MITLIVSGLIVYVAASYGFVYLTLKSGGGGPGGLAWLILPWAPLVLPTLIVGGVCSKVKRIFT